MQFPGISDALLRQRLTPPSGKVSIVLDTDTFNEIDDQYALAYAIRSPEVMTLEAIYAAPFCQKNRSIEPPDGMEKSYEEILRVLDRLAETGKRTVIRGATSFMPGPAVPVENAASRDLVERAMRRSPSDPPLYVVAIAAITDIASAILMEPRIIERIVVLWLGGHSRDSHVTDEFNLIQDTNAARVIFDCGVPLVWVPCYGVASHLVTTMAELERDLGGRSAIGDYLIKITGEHSNDHFAWGKVIWDIAPVAWLIHESSLPSRLAPSPVLAPDAQWQEDASRHLVREVTYIDRNWIFADLFRKLALAPKG